MSKYFMFEKGEKMITIILFFKILTKKSILILLKSAMGSNQIKGNKDICKYEKTDDFFFKY